MVTSAPRSSRVGGTSRALALGAILGFAFAVACSSSSSGSTPNAPPCGNAPTACAAGTTCWPIDTNGTLGCVPSLAAGTFQARCEEKVGVATCADGLTCDATEVGPGNGSCTWYCDATHACPNGFDCRTTHIASPTGPSVNVCRASTSGSGVPGVEAGVGDDGGAGDGAIDLDAAGTDAPVQNR